MKRQEKRYLWLGVKSRMSRPLPRNSHFVVKQLKNIGELIIGIRGLKILDLRPGPGLITILLKNAGKILNLLGRPKLFMLNNFKAISLRGKFGLAILTTLFALSFSWWANLTVAPMLEYRMQLDTLPIPTCEYLLQASKVELAKRHPADFAEYILTDQDGNGIKNGQIHQTAHKFAVNNKFSLIEFPREHGKTEQFAIAKPIWLLGRNPNLRGKIVCANDSLASMRVAAISEHILNNPKVRQVYPSLTPAKGRSWTAHQLFLERQIISKDPSLEGYGVLSSSTGGRADFLIFDDVCDLRNTITQPKLRQAVKDAFYNQWIPLLSPNGFLIYIYTVWHQDDLSHELKRNNEFALFKKVVDSELMPVWPERWPKEKLQERLRQMGNRAFARAFQGQAMTDEEAIFSNIDNCIDRKASIDDIDDNWPRYCGLDLAISQKGTADYTVLFTIAVDPNGRRWVLDIQRSRISSIQTAKMVSDVYKRFNPQIILIENNAYQASFQEWLVMSEGNASMPVKPYTTGKQKFDENIGLPSLAAEIDNNAWIIPMRNSQYPDGVHPSDCNCNVCEWLNEMRSYPVATHDDTVMACFFAWEASMKRRMPGFVI